MASKIQATALDISGSGMRLRVAVKIPAGTAIKIDAKNALVLAEVSRCAHEDGAFTLGVTLLHSLSVFKDLNVLNRALFTDAYSYSEAEPALHS